jgi:N-acetylmuramoyl-L-alanine amidase
MELPISAIAGGMTRRFPNPEARLARAVVAAAVALAVAACGGPPKPQGFDHLYRGLSESLPRIDPSVLDGRRILIDAGHGGYFRGTSGRDSLTEASVNLGVALYLWGLLNEAGADVYLTRSIDRDFLSEEDSSLASDLRYRVAVSDSLEPDVLLSIHHNAQPQRDPSRNRVETYYRAGDPASLDLAFAIHRHLMRNLGIEGGEVRQGNYLILRESKAPAVLGESSYLTNPSVEEKLKLSEKQKLEAEAYFLGVLEYFERGIPRVRTIAPVDSLHETVPALVYELHDDGGAGIDPDGISLSVNGQAATLVIDDLVERAIYNPPWDLPNGPYEAKMSVRNVGGNTSEIYVTRFAVDFPPEFAAFEFTPERIPGRGRAVRARVRLLDRRGLVVSDGVMVGVTTSATPDTVDSIIMNGSIDVTLEVPPQSGPVTVGIVCRGKRFERTVEVDTDPETASRAYHVRDAVTGRPIDDAVVSPFGSVPETVSPNGTYVHWYRLGTDSVQHHPSGTIWSIEAPGYVPVQAPESSPSDTVNMVPWFGGALTGLRFVLDPEGGRPSDTGIGELGLSGSHVNVLVARYLAGYLKAAGGRVLLTRTNDEVRTEEDIARMTNRFRADRYIEIRHRSTHPDSALVVTTYHFPGSGTGARMSQDVLGVMADRLGRPPRGPFETVTYPLQQTACPAIVVGAPSIGSLDEELRLAESWYQREQAYSIFVGVLNHYAVPDSGRVEAWVVGDDVVGWRITLDQTWTLVTGDDGRVVFDKVSPGEHRLSAVKTGRVVEGTLRLAEGESARLRFDPESGAR